VRGDLFERVAQNRLVVPPDVGDYGTSWGRDHARGVVAPADARLQNRPVYARLGKTLQRQRCFQLELRQAVGPGHFQPLDALDEALLGDRQAIQKPALPKIENVRREVRPHGKACGPKETLQKRHRRAFAVGPGDVDHGELVLRIAQALQQGPKQGSVARAVAHPPRKKGDGFVVGHRQLYRLKETRRIRLQERNMKKAKEEITFEIRLKHISPRFVAARLLERGAAEGVLGLQFDESRKRLTIRGTSESVDQARTLARLLDVPQTLQTVEIFQTRYSEGKRRQRRVLSQARLRAQPGAFHEALLMADGRRNRIEVGVTPQVRGFFRVNFLFQEETREIFEDTKTTRQVRTGITGVQRVASGKLFPIHVLNRSATTGITDDAYTHWWTQGGEPPAGESLEVVEIIVHG
jgi:hypothetical protein